MNILDHLNVIAADFPERERKSIALDLAKALLRTAANQAMNQPIQPLAVRLTAERFHTAAHQEDLTSIALALRDIHERELAAWDACAENEAADDVYASLERAHDAVDTLSLAVSTTSTWCGA